MKSASEYSTRRQINIMLLTTLADLRCARKQEAIGYITSHRYFDVQQEDLEPYPKAATREPRWHTLIAWARKDCLVAGYLMEGERDAWAITRDGVKEFADSQEKFRSGILDARRCYMWTPRFKQYMQPGYVLSTEDRKRPMDVYRDLQDATLSRLLAEYALI
jgi:hypothetical protein